MATFWHCAKGSREAASEETTVFYAWPYSRFIEIQETSGERYLIEQIKAPIFLEVVLAMEMMYEPQSNLEEKLKPSILKDDFSSRTNP